jgi:ABC-2 type transport system ATP-binding protein
MSNQSAALSPKMGDKVVISTRSLARDYEVSSKDAGLMAAMKAIFSPKKKIKQALLPLDLEIYQGEIVGLVGANGAGKTTLLKLLSGLIYPSQGSASVLGYTPWERKNDFLKAISLLLGQKNQLWWDISAKDSFLLLIEIYDLDKAKTWKRVDDLVERLQCRHVLTVPLRRLSLGERMKMELIGSLLHNPQILFLDEPTIGLDVVAQANIREFILEELKGSGVTIILTSHYMDDIAQLADRLLLMSHGALAYDGSVGHFMEKTPRSRRLHVDFLEPLTDDIALMPQVTIPKGALTFERSLTSQELLECVKLISSKTIIRDLKIEEPDFEDVIHAFLEKESGVHSSRHRG